MRHIINLQPFDKIVSLERCEPRAIDVSLDSTYSQDTVRKTIHHPKPNEV